MKKICITAVLILSLCCAGLAHADASQDAQAALRTAVDDILSILDEKPLDEAKLRTEIHEIFDFKALTARALGVHWRKFSEQQQTDAADAMSDLLEATYRSALEKYNNQSVEYLNAKTLRENQVEVRTDVVSSSQRLPINYRMELTDGAWHIYDVVIEGVSLVQNYRTQFQEIMLNKSPDELISMLREKAAKKSNNS